jgi:TAP-like protein
VQCNEELSFASPEEVAAAAAQQPLVAGYFEDGSTSGSGIFDVCNSWDAGEAEADANEALTSDIPTLVLAGELDPITPPRWGEEIADGLSDAHFVEFPFTGHGSLSSRSCAVAITDDFLDEPGSEPTTDCVDTIEAPAFTADDVEVEMTSFESDELDLAGVRPEGWLEGVAGVWQESFLISLIQQEVPGVTAQEVLDSIAQQLGSPVPLEPVGELTTGAATWQLYSLVDLGQAVEMALSETPDGLMLIQLTTSPDRRAVHREQIFLPAVEALEPLS